MKGLLIIITFVIVTLFIPSCTETVSPPDSMRLDLVITVVDTSAFTQTLTDSTLVDSAQVFVNSLSYGHYFSKLSDSLGQAVFPQVLPDIYSVSVTKRLSAAEVEQVVGSPNERALNGQLQGLEVSGVVFDTVVYVTPVALGELLISEIYYNGSPADPIPYYFHDQFLELYNNSQSTIYLDSLIIADVSFGHTDEDVIHAVHAYMFPGSGSDHPLEPGDFVIVAQDATNHSLANLSSIDLSGADFEYYVKDKGDVDNQEVPNMIMLQHKYGIDFLYSVFNCALVILRVDDPYEYGYDNFDELLLPKSAILDGVDYRDNLTELDHKRLDITIDAGLTGGFDAYSGKSVERRIDFYRAGLPILMDNNNSSIDFQVLHSPAPGYLTTVDSLP